jgi:hypothetical protein
MGTSIPRLLVATLCVVSSQAFTNPIRNPGADPSVVVSNGEYYMTISGGTHIAITRSSTLGGLLNGETKTVWTDNNPTRNQSMWAPEMHQIKNIWYMFYSSGDGSSVGSDKCRVLNGCDGPIPYDCEYTFLSDLIPLVGSQASPNKDWPGAIDGTYLTIGNGYYSVVSAAGPNSVQAIQIAELNITSFEGKRTFTYSPYC